MLEKLAKSIEEINVLAEHYRTCHNVAAIESLAKEHSISKEDTDAFIAGKRNFLLKVLLTRQAVSVTEKLTEEMLLLQDSGYATVLGTYLLDLARKDPVMKEVILQPHKTLQRCIEYVHEKAYETALEKAKKEGKSGVGQNAGIAIDSICACRNLEEWDYILESQIRIFEKMGPGKRRCFTRGSFKQLSYIASKDL